MANFVGPQQNADNNVSAGDTRRVDRLGAAVVQQLHGKFYEAASRGNVFTASTAATGIALIVPAITGNHPTLWNPSGNLFNLSIIRVTLGYVSGNNAPTTIEWCQTNNTGPSIVAVNGPIITFTAVAPNNAIIGNTSQGTMKWAPAINTFVASPVFVRSTGLSLLTGVAATAVAPFKLRADYDGDLIVAPGNALSLCTQAATSTALFQVTIAYEEVAI